MIVFALNPLIIVVVLGIGWQMGRIVEMERNIREVERRCSYLMRAPHIAVGEPWWARVDRKLGLILKPRFGEAEDAA